MPKGDVENLRADTDDGWCKVAWLLAEALSIMPLTPNEHRIVWAIIRCTYGWVKGKRRSTGRHALLSSRDLADLTGGSQHTVEASLSSLVKHGVVERVEVSRGNVFAYGMNSDVLQWGGGSPEWRDAKVHLRHVQQTQAYQQDRGYLSAETRIGVREITDTYPQNEGEEQPFSPSAASPDGTRQEVRQQEQQQDSEEPHGEVPDPHREETLAQRLAQATWRLYGQVGTPPGNVFAAAQQLVDAHGEKCKDLFRHIRDAEDHALNGAKPGTKVAAVLRSWISEGKRFLWDPTSGSKTKTASASETDAPPSADWRDIMAEVKAQGML